jgi:hypothetical protein
MSQADQFLAREGYFVSEASVYHSISGGAKPRWRARLRHRRGSYPLTNFRRSYRGSSVVPGRRPSGA